MAIVILGTIETDPARRQQLLAALRPLEHRTRADEPGCLAYAFTADNIDDGLVRVVEHWADEESLAAHFRHPNMAATRVALRENGAGRSQVRKYLVDGGEPVKDEQGRYRADFFTRSGTDA